MAFKFRSLWVFALAAKLPAAPPVAQSGTVVLPAVRACFTCVQPLSASSRLWRNVINKWEWCSALYRCGGQW